MVIQSPKVFKEVHMLVDVRRISWSELAQDGHLLLLTALCCPEEDALRVLRKWVAMKTHNDTEATGISGYDPLEEMIKAGDTAIFSKQEADKETATSETTEKRITEEKPLSEIQIDRAIEEELFDEVLKALRTEGALQKMSDKTSKQLESDEAMKACVSEEFIMKEIENVAQKLKAVGNGSRRHLLKIVHESLERTRPMEDLTERVYRSLKHQDEAIMKVTGSLLRREALKRTAEDGSLAPGAKKTHLTS